MRFFDVFAASTSLPPKLARIFRLGEVRVRNLNVAEYSHTRDSRARLVETTFLPRLAVSVTVPEQPCEGETISGRSRRPRARKLYGARAVAARAQRDAQLARLEAAHGDRARDARGLVGAVDGHRDQRVAADVAAARLVVARVGRLGVLADRAVVVQELDARDAAVVAGVDAQRRRAVGGERRGRRRARSRRRSAGGRRTGRRAWPASARSSHVGAIVSSVSAITVSVPALQTT